MHSFFRIIRYIGRYKMLVILALFCSTFYAVMNGFSAYLIGPFMKTIFYGVEASYEHHENVGFLKSINFSFREKINDLIGTGDQHEVLTRLCLLIIVIIVVKNIFSYLQGYIMAFVEQGVVRNLREDVYVSYHRLPLKYFQRKKTGDLISRVINDCNTINTNLNSSLINLMKEPNYENEPRVLKIV